MLHFQLPLRPAFPNVYGPIEFKEQQRIYQRIDEILRKSGIEMSLIASALKSEGKKNTPKNVAWLLSGFRCAIARKLTGMSLRAFTVRLADSNFLQWFSYCGDFGPVNPCSKSSLKRFEAMFDLSELENAIVSLTLGAADTREAFRLGALNEALDLGDVFADCTCAKANIHYPVDWVLLVDCVRTLSLGIKQIRKKGLKHRMPCPTGFMSEMNSLAMSMSSARRTKDSKKKRKKILRKMKVLVRTLSQHAQRHRDLLDAEWKKTEWTRKQAEGVIERIDQVLDQVPAAIKQAHERIIGERKVANKDKILSLYEPDVKVNVRGKTNAEVEFGNKLYLGEQRNGMLVDWKLYKDNVPNDSLLVRESLERMELSLGLPEGFVSDRGFPSKPNVEWLEGKGIKDGMCPKDPEENRKRREDPWFKEVQKRRGSTEARIGIFKNKFLGGVMKEKGFENRNRSLIWSVLAHNLWVLSRKSLADEDARLEAAA